MMLGAVAVGMFSQRMSEVPLRRTTGVSPLPCAFFIKAVISFLSCAMNAGLSSLNNAERASRAR